MREPRDGAIVRRLSQVADTESGPAIEFDPAARPNPPAQAKTPDADKRADKPPATNREEETTASEAVPIKKWFSLVSSPNSLVGWDTADCRVSYAKRVIELREGTMFCPIVVRDATIRATIKCRAESHVRLLLRHSPQGAYAARISGGMIAIVKQKPSKLSNEPDESVLAKTPIPRRLGDRAFEFGFSAAGDTLTAFVGGGAVIQAKDKTFAEGDVGLATNRDGNVIFSNVSMLVPEAESVIADRRRNTATP
jgi:hypothetical protein